MLLLWWQLWELLWALGLEVSLGQPDLPPAEDGYNPRHASLVTGQMGTQSWERRKT